MFTGSERSDFECATVKPLISLLKISLLATGSCDERLSFHKLKLVLIHMGYMSYERTANQFV